MPAPRQLRPERDRGKGVPGVAERREQESVARASLDPGRQPAGGGRLYPRLAQSISASSRTIRLCSFGPAAGATIKVPTPASR